jgi:hypothetical protein
MPIFSSIKSRGPFGQKGAKVKLTATGGQGTQTIGTYKYHTFTSNGTLTVIGSGPIEILAVGGGGGGGSQPGIGGGGGGGVIAYDSYICTSNLSITIGNGSGAGAVGSANGGSTTVTGTGISVTALGGGGQSRGTASGQVGSGGAYSGIGTPPQGRTNGNHGHAAGSSKTGEFISNGWNVDANTAQISQMSGMTYLASGGAIGPNPNHGGYAGNNGPGAGFGYGGSANATWWGAGGGGGTNMNYHFTPGGAGRQGIVVVRYLV